MSQKLAAPARAFIKRAAFWLFWPAMAVVIYGQLSPDPEANLPDLGWDKLLHFTAYFGLSLLATLAWGRRVHALLILAVVLALGGALEIIQSMVGRDAEWGDMLANTLGAMLGTGLAVGALTIAKRVDARHAGTRLVGPRKGD